MAFHDDLARHAEQVRARVPHIKGEEATKHALVVPLLQVLGYDVFDPREVQPEYIADFAKKKSSGQMEKIDYVVRIDGLPAIFVECKDVTARLEDHDGQLARYFNATPSVKVAILTNGVRLRAYTDLQQPNMMDPTPWLDIDLLNPRPAEIETLKRFRKVDFSTEQVVALAEETLYFTAMTAFISAQLREPGDSFVRYVAGEIPAVGRITARVVERLAPIVRKAIHASIVEHVAKSFDRVADAPEIAAPPAPAVIAGKPAPVEAEAAAPDARPGIVTSAEEIHCWETIAKWIREVRPNTALAYRDSKGYFTIHQNNVRKWFVRLNVSKVPHWVSLRHVQPDDMRRLAPGLDLADPAGTGDVRVLLRSLDDLPKLRAAIIASSEKEATRVVDDGDKSPPDDATN